MNKKSSIVSLAIIAFTATAAFAQLDTATISGRIVDQTGAVVIGADVSTTNAETNFANQSKSNEDGLYRISTLRPGNYKLVITAPGFKRYVREAVNVRGGDNVAINVNLELGSVSDSVTVDATTPLLETESSTTGTVLQGTYFQKLPLYQRDPKNVLYLTPGVQYQGNGYAGNLSSFHLDGLPDTSIGLFEDGMIGTSPTGSVSGNNRGVDSIMNSVEEIKVLTSGLPAEYGHSAGGAITIIKKSGTNLLHGQVSEIARTRRMQHRKFFDKYRTSQIQPGTTSAATIFVNEPDFNINGPVFIPKIYDGRNKTFFMFGYQKYIEKQGKQTTYTVPTPEMLNGDFSNFSGVVGQPIYDPRTTRSIAGGKWDRDLIVGGKIPVSQFDPVAKKILALNPWTLPNQAGTITPSGVSGNLLLTAQKVVPWDYYTARVDQQLGTAARVYASWTYNNKFEVTPNPNVANSLLDGSRAVATTRTDTGSIGLSYTLSPTLVTDTRIGYNRQASPTLSQAYQQNYAGLFGIPNDSPDTFPGGVIPNLPGYNNPSINTGDTVSAKTDWTNVRGRHTLKFGYELVLLRQNSYGVGSPSGSFSYASTSGLLNNTNSSVNNTGNGFAGFLLGSISSASANIPLVSWLPRSTQHSFYVQDDWKVTPTLTLNLGMRYQTESPFDSKYHQISNFDPFANDNLVAGGKGLITHPTNGLNRRDWNNFQPRLGIAWNPGKKIAIRSAFALSTQDMKLSVTQTSEYSNTANITAPNGDPRPLFQISAFPGFGAYYPALRADGTSPFLTTSANYSSRGVNWIDQGIRNPYTMSWNFNIQYQLGKHYLLETSYQGSAAVGLIQGAEYNGQSYQWAQDLRVNNPTAFTAMIANSQAYRPYTNYGGITLQTNRGHSTFNDGTIKLEKRYSGGLTFITFYTFAKSLDNAGGGNYLLDGKLLKSRSSFDQTHKFNSSFTYELPFGKGRHFMSGGGIKDKLLGGWNYVTVYQAQSGTPMTFGYGDAATVAANGTRTTIQYLPGMVASVGGRPNMTQRPALRDNWQDLGGDRFTTGNQNSMFDPVTLTYMSYPDAFTMGNAGRNIVDSQRVIAMSMSVSKEVQIKERLKYQIRLDYQNPFAWYNWASTPNTTFTNLAANAKANYGKPGQGGEATTNNGGAVMMNLTMAFVW